MHIIFVVSLFKLLWKPARTGKPEVRVYFIPPMSESRVFADYFDQVQAQLETLASMDDLLSGTYNMYMQPELNPDHSVQCIFFL